MLASPVRGSLAIVISFIVTIGSVDILKGAGAHATPALARRAVPTLRDRGLLPQGTIGASTLPNTGQRHDAAERFYRQ
ncbi:MAG: hypothetical protein ABI881_06785 [Betaproteobacteria bacterium]